MKNFRIVRNNIVYDEKWNPYERDANNIKHLKEDNGDRFYAISQDGSLHQMEREDMASKLGDSVYAIEEGSYAVDEASHPLVDGKPFIIYGATEDGYYTDSAHKHFVLSHDITTPTKSVVVTHNNKEKMEERDILRQKYVLLEEAMKKFGVWGNRP